MSSKSYITWITLLLLAVLIVSCSKSKSPGSVVPPVTPGGDTNMIYKNPNATIDARMSDLLGRMSLTEKIAQMAQIERSVGTETAVKSWNIGSILSGGGSQPYAGNTTYSWANQYDAFQGQAAGSRLGIPLLYGVDAVHGHNNVYGAVIFPHNIGLGCTRNTTLVENAFKVVAEEVAGTGIDWTFAPCIAVARDERWGRTYESFSENTDLVSQMGVAAVKGLQGTSLNPSSILACIKHFIADGGTTGGKDQGNAQMDETTLRAIHLPPYIAAINAGAKSVMVSYSSWNGIKMHGNKHLITDVLKGELGFSGIVVSDYQAIDQLPGDYSSQVEVSINAGIDMIMLPFATQQFLTTLESLVNSGRVSQARINDAVTRILRVKFQMGLFESPYTDRSKTATIGSSAHRALARDCVRQSLVLLKNSNSVLPLSKTSKIHVSGRIADDIGKQCGGWTINWQGGSGNITTGTTILQGIKSAASNISNISFTIDGTSIAPGSQAGVVVIGEDPYAEYQGDKQDLSLSAADISAVQKFKQAGLPVVVVLISGRPMILDPIINEADAILAAWLPGTEGQGVADVLFGDYNPTGKLSFSWPRSMSQVPVNTGDANYDPLFAYGFGLAYP